MTNPFTDTRRELSGKYYELDSSYIKGTLKLSDVVVYCFNDLAPNSDVTNFKLAAIEIARRIDCGDDQTDSNVYHNRLHFAKVVFSFYQLARLHNSLCEPSDRLTADEIAMGLLAATAHDVCHDGHGNTLNGIHTPLRLEHIAINHSRQWVSEKYPDMDLTAINHALKLVYATDVSGKHPTPADYIRCAYDMAYKGRMPTLDAPINLLGQLHPILTSPKMVLLASLLQDSDIFSSVVDEHHHAKENLRVAYERRGATDTLSMAQSGSFFIEKLLKLRLTTDVANHLIGDNLRMLQQKHALIIRQCSALG
jgi:hypothetical protein